MRIFPMILAGGAVLAVAGCSVGDDLQALIKSGSEKNEYRAVRNQPLVVPPGFDLRPPVGGGGGDVRRARSTTVRARRVVVGGAAVGNTVPGTGERALVRQAGRGVRGVSNAVRQEIDRTTKDTTVREKRFTDKLLKWERRKGGEVRKSRLGGRIDPIIKREGEIF